MEIREELIQKILSIFLKDLSESIEPIKSVNEGIDFIEALSDFASGIYNHEPAAPEFNYEGSPFDEDEFIEKRLLQKYRDKMIPFVKTSLRYYFAKDEFNQTQLFQKLQLKEVLFSHEEYEDYILRLFFILKKMKEN